MKINGYFYQTFKISRLEVENIVAKAEAKWRVAGVRLDIADEVKILHGISHLHVGLQVLRLGM